MTRLAVILLSLSLTACATASGEGTRAVVLGARFTLAPGATATVKATKLKVRFVSVTEDSRCPRDVNCFWAGEARVMLVIIDAQAESPVEIPERGSSTAGGYRVTVVRVEPQRTSFARIEPRDYRATLKIDKAG